jgi:ribosomal protein S18 acetylase RimI-like enzyme
MDKMLLLTPTPKHAEEINTLFTETWLATYPNEAAGISRDDVEDLVSKWSSLDGVARRRNFYKDLPTKPDIYNRIAVVDEKVVGFCGGFENDERVHLKSLYILPGYQRRGIGRALFSDFEVWANKEKKITVHVVNYNTNAIRFYEKCGFLDTGKRFSEERFRMKSGANFTEIEMVK